MPTFRTIAPILLFLAALAPATPLRAQQVIQTYMDTTMKSDAIDGCKVTFTGEGEKVIPLEGGKTLKKGTYSVDLALAKGKKKGTARFMLVDSSSSEKHFMYMEFRKDEKGLILRSAMHTFMDDKNTQHNLTYDSKNGLIFDNERH